MTVAKFNKLLDEAVAKQAAKEEKIKKEEQG